MRFSNATDHLKKTGIFYAGLAFFTQQLLYSE
jgi:hypothetical protein